MDWSTLTVQLLTAFLGAFGYALLFQVNRDKLFGACAGGFIAWLVYLLCGSFTGSNALKYFIASVVVTFYAEFMARRKKTPATVFLAPATIPLIPGGSLYQTMAYALRGEWEKAFSQGLNTILLAVAISCGILMTMTLMGIAGKGMQRIVVFRDRKL